MATFETPWPINDVEEALHIISSVRYPEVQGNYSKGLKNIIQQCLQKSPAQRPDIEALLKTPVINRRISQYLESDVFNQEFEKTVIKTQMMFYQNQLESEASASVQTEDDISREVIDRRKQQYLEDIEDLIDESSEPLGTEEEMTPVGFSSADYDLVKQRLPNIEEIESIMQSEESFMNYLKQQYGEFSESFYEQVKSLMIQEITEEQF